MSEVSFTPAEVFPPGEFIRLNQQWRLILEFEGEAPEKVTVVVSIEDYH